MPSNDNATYDVAIIGGGLIGASLLLALKNAGLKIALIEANKHQQRTDPILDQRSLVLSLGSKLYFEQLGLGQEIEKHATPIRKIKVSEQGKFAKVTLDQKSLHVAALGYVINIQLLNQLIWDSLASVDNIDVFCPAKVETLQTSKTKVNIQLHGPEGAQTVIAKMAVAADGARSSIRKILEVSATEHNYKQWALIANVEHELANDNIAYERFSASGPFAILPRENKYISGIVWPWDESRIDYVRNLSDDDLLFELQKLFGYKLGKFTRIGARQFFPLSRITTNELYKNRIIFLGNAANSIHPIAGQGFNLGLRDVKYFSKILLEYFVCGDQLEQELIDKIFSSYSNAREDDHKNLIDGTHRLLNLFASKKKSVQLFRNFSMMVMDHSLILRTMIADRSMGLIS